MGSNPTPSANDQARAGELRRLVAQEVDCTLPKGSYERFVYATDQSGHGQILVGAKSMEVK